MIFTGKCPKCGNKNIAGPFRVHGGDRHVKLDLPGVSTATLDSFCCSNCGYTEFYVDRGGIANVQRAGRFIEVPDRSPPPSRDSRCSNCGRRISASDEFCPHCGGRV